MEKQVWPDYTVGQDRQLLWTKEQPCLFLATSLALKDWSVKGKKEEKLSDRVRLRLRASSLESRAGVGFFQSPQGQLPEAAS